MKAWTWTGKRYTACSRVPLTDRGFRYGMAVFESLRVASGAADFFDAHLSRLLSACAERGFPVEESTLRAVAAVLLRTARSGFARLYVTAGDGAPDAAPAPRIFLFLEDRTPPDPDDPWELTFHEDTHRLPFGGLKTANYWFHTDALAQARRRGFNEALFFNDFAELVSASMANVFLVHDGRISTPARSCGCRSGVIREWVIARRKVEERRLRREDVLSADEIFLTNSWIGVMPVGTLEGRPLGRRSIGPTLAAEFAQRSS